MKRLTEKYQSDDRVAQVELRRRLDQVEMKRTAGPSELFELIASINNSFESNRQTVDAEDLIATVLEKAPVDYTGILATEKRTKGSLLTLKHLEAAIDTEYRIRYGVKCIEVKKYRELHLTAFDGKCYRHGEEGHKAADCPNGD